MKGAEKSETEHGPRLPAYYSGFSRQNANRIPQQRLANHTMIHLVFQEDCPNMEHAPLKSRQATFTGSARKTFLRATVLENGLNKICSETMPGTKTDAPGEHISNDEIIARNFVREFGGRFLASSERPANTQ